MKKILFVCLGNICRSPLAEGIAQKHIADMQLNVEVDSAGTSNWHKGEHPCSNSIKIAKQHGIDISQQISRTISKKDIDDFYYVVAMDERNREELLSFGFPKVYKLGDFGGYGGKDVPDPYFFPGFEGFEKVYEMVYLTTKDFIEKKLV